VRADRVWQRPERRLSGAQASRAWASAGRPLSIHPLRPSSWPRWVRAVLVPWAQHDGQLW